MDHKSKKKANAKKQKQKISSLFSFGSFSLRQKHSVVSFIYTYFFILDDDDDDDDDNCEPVVYSSVSGTEQ